MTTDAPAYTYAAAYLATWAVELPIAQEGKTQYFPVRALCLALGVSSQTQLLVLHANSRYAEALRDIPQRTDAGWRVSTWIRRAEAALWIAGIDPQRVKKEIREVLNDFQTELMAEADRLLFGGRPRIQVAHRGETSYAQREEIRIVCQDCGAPHLIVVENGVVRVERERN